MAHRGGAGHGGRGDCEDGGGDCEAQAGARRPAPRPPHPWPRRTRPTPRPHRPPRAIPGLVRWGGFRNGKWHIPRKRHRPFDSHATGLNSGMEYGSQERSPCVSLLWKSPATTIKATGRRPVCRNRTEGEVRVTFISCRTRPILARTIPRCWVTRAFAGNSDKVCLALLYGSQMPDWSGLHGRNTSPTLQSQFYSPDANRTSLRGQSRNVSSQRLLEDRDACLEQ